MKKIIIKAFVLFILLLTIVIAFKRIKHLKEENYRLTNNQDIILTENEKYKVSDSLNAIRTRQLEFSLEEYKRYKADDMKLIKQLKSKKSDLEKVISSQLETIKQLSVSIKDSVRVDTITYVADTLKCFNYKSVWIDINGCVDLKSNTADLQIKNRDSLQIIETVEYKRFLGFLWKTKRVKNKFLDVVSKNPNTEILDCEYISIRR